MQGNNSNKNRKDNDHSFYVLFIILGTTLGVLVGVFLWRDPVESFYKLASTLGSLGTAGTLAYLIYDGRKSRGAVKIRDEKQDEMRNFQKYQMHRQSFDERLDSLEFRYKFLGLHRQNL
ncbi:hypothetical protein, partial [Vibrio sp. 10N.261.52.F3]